MTTDEREARALRLALVAFDKAEVAHLTGALAKEYTRIKASCEAYTAAMTEGSVVISREDADDAADVLDTFADGAGSLLNGHSGWTRDVQAAQKEIKRLAARIRAQLEGK